MRWVQTLSIAAAGLAGMVAGSARLSAAEQEQRVTGTERIAWDVTLDPGATASSYDFAVYVDGVRRSAFGVQCGSASRAILECTAPLPSLTSGRHVLEMVAVLGGLESARSNALIVHREEVEQIQPFEDVIGHGASVVDEPLGSSVEPPRDAAVARSGKLVIVDQTGQVSIIDPAGSTVVNALTLNDVDTTAGRGLFSVALHPGYEQNRFVYLAYAARAADGPVYRVIRARESGNTLGEIATVLDGVPAHENGWATVRFGPDGKLYVAIAASSPPSRNADPYHGAVLRLEGDGTTPSDSRGASPVFARDIGHPRGLAWAPDGTLWIASRHDDGFARLHHVGVASYALPDGVSPSGVAIVAKDEGATLWIASESRDGVYKISLTDADRLTASSALPFFPLAQGRIGCVVADGRSGAYVCVGNRGNASARGVIRLDPE